MALQRLAGTVVAAGHVEDGCDAVRGQLLETGEVAWVGMAVNETRDQEFVLSVENIIGRDHGARAFLKVSSVENNGSWPGNLVSIENTDVDNRRFQSRWDDTAVALVLDMLGVI